MKIPFTRNTNVIVEVPEGGSLDSLPVVLALHGMGESAESFRKKLSPLIERSTYALIIPDAPLPFEVRRAKRLGYAWYVFAGDQDLLRESMNAAVEHLLATLDAVLPPYKQDRKISVVGFSQGGYLASVLGGNNPNKFHSVCCIGGRLKHEFFGSAGEDAPRFLQLHGVEDKGVLLDLAAKAIEPTKELGYEVEIQSFENTGHEVTPEMLEAFWRWEAKSRD